jgi:hypothetical protein
MWNAFFEEKKKSGNLAGIAEEFIGNLWVLEEWIVLNFLGWKVSTAHEILHKKLNSFLLDFGP